MNLKISYWNDLHAMEDFICVYVYLLVRHSL